MHSEGPEFRQALAVAIVKRRREAQQEGASWRAKALAWQAKALKARSSLVRCSKALRAAAERARVEVCLLYTSPSPRDS